MPIKNEQSRDRSTIEYTKYRTKIYKYTKQTKTTEKSNKDEHRTHQEKADVKPSACVGLAFPMLYMMSTNLLIIKSGKKIDTDKEEKTST